MKQASSTAITNMAFKKPFFIFQAQTSLTNEEVSYG